MWRRRKGNRSERHGPLRLEVVERFLGAVGGPKTLEGTRLFWRVTELPLGSYASSHVPAFSIKTSISYICKDISSGTHSTSNEMRDRVCSNKAPYNASDCTAVHTNLCQNGPSNAPA
jgi:hypothetical protein